MKWSERIWASIVAERSLVTVAGARPPASFDFASVAQVRLTAGGEAEWVITGGTNPRGGIVAVEGSALMRWPPLVVASFVAVSMDQAAGPTGTAEGVAALARGDYQQAADILKPIAEGWRQPDPMAQFFMATLYQTGHGVPQDLLRACALYHARPWASTTPSAHKRGNY